MSHLSMILLVVLILCFSSAAVSEECHPHDKKVLLQVKKELGNTDSLSSWLPTTNCCNGSWEGISCAFNTNRVDAVSFSNLNLSKPTPIPSSIGNIPYLGYLNIGFSNNIVGPIPPTIVKLTRLHSLYIQYTNVSGHIPRFLSQIKTFQIIYLSYNRLTGTLPASLSSLPNLVGFSFDGNRITGSIPESYGSFSNKFNVMTISRNRLTGKIPATLAKLNLAVVDLSRNMLEGDASVLFGSHKNTQRITLKKNFLAFDFGKVGLSKELINMDVSRNRLYGTLPKGLTALKHLRRLNVSFNNLCGQIPQDGDFQEYDPSCFSNNKCLCGSPLPPCT